MRQSIIALIALPLLACGGPGAEPLGTSRSALFGDPKPVPNPQPLPVIPAPVISSLSPASGYPGTVVTLTGTNFQNAGLFGPYAIRLSSSSVVSNCTTTYLSPTQISFVVPDLWLSAAQAFSVDIFQTGGAYQGTVRASSPTSFGYVAPASLSLVNRTQGQIDRLSVDGVLVANLALPPGASQPITVPAGQHLFTAGVDLDGTGQKVVSSSASLTTIYGAANTLAIPRLTAGQLLSDGGPVINGVLQRSWFGTDSRGRQLEFVFFADGRWAHYSDGRSNGSGVASEFSWPDLASSIRIGVGGGHAPLTIASPFTWLVAENVVYSP